MRTTTAATYPVPTHGPDAMRHTYDTDHPAERVQLDPESLVITMPAVPPKHQLAQARTDDRAWRVARYQTHLRRLNAVQAVVSTAERVFVLLNPTLACVMGIGALLGLVGWVLRLDTLKWAALLIPYTAAYSFAVGILYELLKWGCAQACSALTARAKHYGIEPE